MFGKKKNDDGMEGDAKMKVLADLRSSMSDMMANKMKDGYSKMGGLQKVSVMAPNKEGLEKGLDKAQDMVESPHMAEMSPENMDRGEKGPMSAEEIDHAISILQQLKEEMSGESDSSQDEDDEDEIE